VTKSIPTETKPLLTKTATEELVEKQKISPHTPCQGQRTTKTAKPAVRYNRSLIGLTTMGRFILFFPLSSLKEAV